MASKKTFRYWAISFVLIVFAAALGVGYDQFPRNDGRSKALRENPCGDEIWQYCREERGYETFYCLKKQSNGNFSTKCVSYMKHLEELGEPVRAEFKYNCGPFFSSCKDLPPESAPNQRARRQCIVDQINKVSPECRSALEKDLERLPVAWRPKNWPPPVVPMQTPTADTSSSK
jgi:hypothetical protein